MKAEYIIMEKAKGVPLESVYDRMGIKQRWPLVQTLADYQLSWAAASFQQYGSLYYKEDLETSVTDNNMFKPDDLGKASRFAVGPSISAEWNEHETFHLDFDRGPCEPSLISIRILMR